MLIAGYLSRLVGPSYQVPAFIILQCFYVVGLFYAVWTEVNQKTEGKGISLILPYYSNVWLIFHP